MAENIISPFDVQQTDQEAFEQQTARLQKLWDDQSKRILNLDFDEWAQNQKAAGKDVYFDSFDDFYKYWTKYVDRPSARNAFQRNVMPAGLAGGLPRDWWIDDQETKQRIDLKRQQTKDLKKLFDKKQQERYQSLPQALQQAEVRMGGIYPRTYGVGLRDQVFHDALTDGVTLGWGYKPHPVYGDDHRLYNPELNTAGALTGEIINFMALSGVASKVIGVPTKLMGLTKKSNVALKTLRVFGKTGHYLSTKMGIIPQIGRALHKAAPTLFAAPQVLTAEARGAQAITTGLVKAFQSGVAASANKYRFQDSLTQSEYHKEVPETLFDWMATVSRGFVSGVSLNTINAPNAWSLRFAGDAVYSSGQQLYRIITGQQRGWDHNMFWRDFLMGHVMGEIQGKMMSFPANVREALMKNRVYADYSTKLDSDPVARDFTKEERALMSSILLMSEDQHIRTTGKPMTDDMRVLAIKELLKPFVDDRDILALYKSGPQNTAFIRESDINNVDPTVRQAIANDFAQRFGWDEDTTRQFVMQSGDSSYRAFRRFVPDDVVVKTRGRQPAEVMAEIGEFTKANISPMGTEEFATRIQRLINDFDGRRLGKRDRALVNELKKLDVEEITNPDDMQIREAIAQLDKAKKTPLTDEQKEIAMLHRDEVMSPGMFNREMKGLVTFFSRSGIKTESPQSLASEVFMLANQQSTGYFYRRASEGSTAKETLYALAKQVVGKIKKGYQTDPERIGLDEWDLNRPATQPDETKATINERDASELRYLYEVASESPVGLRNAVIRYLETVRQFTPSDIQRLFTKYDISFPGRFSNYSNEAGESSALGKKVLDRLSKTVYHQRKKYTDTMLRELYTDTMRQASRHNPITGFPTDYKGVAEQRAIKDKGAFTFSLEQQHKFIQDEYGTAAADRVLQVTSRMLQRQVDIINEDLRHRTIKSQVALYNDPTDSRRFVLLGRGLEQKDFNEFGNDLYNIMRGRYSDDQGIERTMAVIVGRTQNNQPIVMENLGEIYFGYTKSPGDVDQMVTDHADLKKLAAHASEQTAQMIDDMFFNYSDQAFRANVQRLFSALKTDDGYSMNKLFEMRDSGLFDRLLVDIAESTVQVPRFTPEIVNAETYVEDERAANLGDKPLDLDKGKIKTRRYNVIPEKLIKMTYEKLGVTDDDVFTRIDRALNNTDKALRKSAERIKNKTDAIKGKDRGDVNTGVTSKATTPPGWGEKIKRWARTTVFGDFKKTPAGEKFIIGLFDAASKGEEAYNSYMHVVARETYGDFYNRVLGGDEKKFTFYDFVVNEIRTREYAPFYKDFEDPAQARDYMNEITKPINWKPNVPLDLDRLINDPHRMKGGDLLDIYEASNDRLVMSKIIVQKLGVSPEDLYTQQRLEDANIFQEHKLLQKQLWEAGGEYKGYKEKENLVNKMEESIKKSYQKTFGKDISGWDLRAEDTRKAINNDIEQAIKTTPETEPAREAQVLLSLNDFKLRMQHYTDFINGGMDSWSFDFTRVIKSPFNKENFKGEINEALDETAGRYNGATRAESLMRELNGKTSPTRLGLIERGYKVEMSAFNARMAATGYLYSKIFNQHFADSMKRNFVDLMWAKYKPIRQIEDRYDAIKETRDLPDSRKEQMLTEIVAEKQRAVETFIEDMKDSLAGWLYIPDSSEFTIVNRAMQDIDNMLEALNRVDSDDQQTKIELGNKRADLEARKDALEWLSEVWTGDAYVREMRELNGMFKNSNDPQVSTANMDGDTKRQILEDQKAEIERQRVEYQRQMKQNIFIGKDDYYLPMHSVAYLSDKRYKVDAGQEQKFDRLGVFRENLKTMEPLDRMKAPTRIEGFQGLLLKKEAMMGMQEFIFRNDLWQDDINNPITKLFFRGYDRANSVLKVMGLVKPTIMLANDLAQSYLKVGIRTFNPFDLWTAYKVIVNKHDPHNDYGKLYWHINRTGVYNKNVGIPSMLGDAHNAYLETLGKNHLFGLEKYVRQITRDVQNADPKLGSKLVGKLWQSVISPFRAWQEQAWRLDELMRTNAMIIEYKRLAANSPSDEIAWYRAGEKVNRFMVNYAETPTHVRRFANRFFAYPTFRVGTMRMYRDLFKDAITGIQRLAGKDIPTNTSVSDNKFEQAAYEIGPMLRLALAQGAVKLMFGAMFGYTWDGAWDMITNYRAKRFVEGDRDFNDTMQFISLSTPLFELNKYMRRPLTLTLRYNMARVPMLGWSLLWNRNGITGQRIFTEPFADDVKGNIARLGLDFAATYMPFGSDIMNIRGEDIGFFQNMLNFSGLAFYYEGDNPQSLLRDYREAINKAGSDAERRQALQRLRKGLDRASNQLFERKFRSVYEDIDEAAKRAERNMGRRR